MTTIEVALARNIRKKRLEKGLSRNALAELLDCSRYNIGNWENAKNMPSAWFLCLLADELECSVDELLGRTTLNSKED